MNKKGAIKSSWRILTAETGVKTGHTKIDENAETIENYPIPGVPFLY